MTSPDITVSMPGNLTADPILRYTDSGTAVASFTIAHTPRVYRNDQWEDEETIFMYAEVWREQAENLACSLHRGARVNAAGVLRMDSWEDKDTGEKKTRLKMVVTEIGASLRYATAEVHRKISKITRDIPPPVDPATGEAATERRAPANA